MDTTLLGSEGRSRVLRTVFEMFLVLGSGKLFLTNVLEYHG